VETTDITPLTPDEDTAWRALTYVANHLVKTLGEDLADETSLSLSEYVVLVHLSEAADQRLRIGDLAEAVGLSPSRMSRLVDQMAIAGLVAKIHLEGDARCMFAAISESGLDGLKAAYPMQLRNVRRRVFDHLSANEVKVLGRALEKVRSGLDL
jgi:DNA-binding MarR family transcriptional regulator